MGKYLISESDHRILKQIVRWWNENKNLRHRFRRRNISSNTSGLSSGIERRAKIQAGGVPSNNTGPFTCKLLGADGNETGDNISVYPREHLGSNNFDSGDVHPSYSATDIMSVFKDLNNVYYTKDVFEDTTDCICIST